MIAPVKPSLVRRNEEINETKKPQTTRYVCKQKSNYVVWLGIAQRLFRALGCQSPGEVRCMNKLILDQFESVWGMLTVVSVMGAWFFMPFPRLMIIAIGSLGVAFQ